jgi:hypothetical protein
MRKMWNVKITYDDLRKVYLSNLSNNLQHMYHMETNKHSKSVFARLLFA